MKPTRIVWHHSADPSKTAQFDKINIGHRNRGFPQSELGTYVGYHWLIEPDGTLRQSHLETEIGAHDTDENLNSIGICLAGDFTNATPTEAQRATAAKLIGDIRKRWNIPLTRIEPHRWDDNTACPGALLSDNFLINEYLTREGSVFFRFFQIVGQKFNLL